MSSSCMLWGCFVFCTLGSMVVAVFAGDKHTCKALPSVGYFRQRHLSSHLQSGTSTSTGSFLCFGTAAHVCLFPLSKIATSPREVILICSFGHSVVESACEESGLSSLHLCSLFYLYRGAFCLFAQLKGIFDWSKCCVTSHFKSCRRSKKHRLTYERAPI